jgi:ComF family protein
MALMSSIRWNPLLWSRAVVSTGRGLADELFPHVRDADLARALEAGWKVDLPETYCRRCGATAGPGAVTDKGCAVCFKERLPWQSVVRLSAYRPPMSRWIVGMKFARAWSWGPWFGRQLADRIGQMSESQGTLVCPVPMHWWRRWRRGYDQAHLMAVSLATQQNWRFAPLLRRVRYTPPQTSMPPSRRQLNIRGSFGIHAVDLHGWNIWLVDDVKTSGSTLKACARLLRRAGAMRINVAVAAVADPHRHNFHGH